MTNFRLSVIALCVLGAIASCTSPRVCDPGRVVTCPCVGGGSGTQSCRSDGSGYGECVGCGTSTDAGDAADDLQTPADSSAADAPSDAVSSCVFPATTLTTAPTPGHCEGSTAVRCTPTGTTERVDCG
ncbi:MAG: hypothetical protein WCJ30_28950, partial [Deltaproteobacteria bacterium]